MTQEGYLLLEEATLLELYTQVMPCQALEDTLEVLFVLTLVSAEDQDIIYVCSCEGFASYQDFTKMPHFSSANLDER